MATERRAWTTERTWAIKGVSDRTRDAALEAAHAAVSGDMQNPSGGDTRNPAAPA